MILHASTERMKRFANSVVALRAQVSRSRSRTGRWLALGLGLALLLFGDTSVVGQDTVFGPKTHTRTSGPPNAFLENFSVSNTNSSFTLTVQNGAANGNGRISSGEIVLNDAEVVRESDFNQQVALIRRTVTLRASNTLRIRLRSAPGSFITVSIVQDPTPVLSITSPPSGTVLSAQPITVMGTIDTDQARVTVNGVPADVSGRNFAANNVPLRRDGTHIITAVGTGPGGNTGQASIVVALDTTAPVVIIDSPSTGFSTADDTIAIAGMVSDVMTANPTVTVNGVPASVNNGTFIAMGIPLATGANAITATARDSVGNVGTATITVNRAALPGLRLTIRSGQAQSASINTTLPVPLTVRLVDGNGDPLSNREVVFQASRGDGTIRNSPPIGGQTGQRTLNVRTDASGQAAVQFTLGSRTGAGNNRVQVSVAGGLSFVEFCATATSGTPDRIAIIPMSNQQTGVVNRALAEPFAAVVSDLMGNPVTDVPVRFRVTEGGGNFDGSPMTTVNTGADGIARALLTLGPEVGTQDNVVTAAYEGQTDPPIVFAASGRLPGLLGNTTFSGIVLDNGDRPLRNARAVIEGTDRVALTDAMGRFQITNVPPGSQRLFIDGSAIADSLGRIFPDLEFDVNTIGGVDNALPFPIYLPPLATEAGSVARITGPVTTPVTLQMPGVPEATLTLLPGTIVRNASGPASETNPITVRLSRVNNDRVPMPPPNGSVFMLAGTVQPAGTQFSVPARICVPNAGMAPGAQVDIFSFDHDVGQFLSIGLATVNEDGSVLCSNRGFGIRKAGWWGCTPPPPPSTDVQPPRVLISPKPIFVALSKMQGVSATGSPTGGTYSWNSSNTEVVTISGSGNSVTLSGVAVGTATITVSYSAIDGMGRPQTANDTATVTVFNVQITRIISGQLSNRECNKLPDPHPRRSMMYMGAQGDNRAHLQIETTVTPTEVPNGLARVGIMSIDDDGRFTEVLESAPIQRGRTPLAFSFPVFSEYLIVAGSDSNGDRKLDISELTAFFPNRVRVIYQGDFDDARDLIRFGSLFPFGHASEFVAAFATNTDPYEAAPGAAELLSTDLSLSHPIGVVWGPDCNANVRHYTFADGTNVSNDVEINPAVEQSIINVLRQHENDRDLRDFLSNPNRPERLFGPWSWGASDLRLNGPSLFLAFGHVTVLGEVRVTVRASDGRVTRIQYTGTFKDIYDFDFAGEFPAPVAAAVQAGYPTLGGGGGGAVFVTTVEFDFDGVPNFTFAFPR